MMGLLVDTSSPTFMVLSLVNILSIKLDMALLNKVLDTLFNFKV